MKLDEVRNLIRKGSRRNDDFADEFLRDAEAAGTRGVSSQEWSNFADKYFANDPDALGSLGQGGGQLDSGPYFTTGVLTGSGGCTTVTYYESDPYFDGGSGGAQTP